MGAFNSFMEAKFMPVAARTGSQKHLVAIRDSFIAIMPITMVGSIAVLLNVFLRDLPNQAGMTGFVQAMSPVISVNGNVYFGSIVILALAFVFALGYNLSKTYNVNAIAGGVIAFASLVTCMGQSAVFDYELPGVAASSVDQLKGMGLDVAVNLGGGVTLNGVGGWGYLGSAYTGSGGLFTALIMGFICTMIYIKLMQKKITIKLPDSVPPAVSKAFAAIVPGVIAIYFAGIATQVCISLTGSTINEMVLKYIQRPLLSLSQGFFSVILMVFLVQLLWFFGLHGHNVLAPVMDGIYLTALNQNIEAFTAGQSTSQLPYLWTRGSFDAYCQMGGSGITLGLIIAIFLFSKREDQRAIAKLSWPMGVFNINEPITFGMPIVLNPVYLIPWLIVPPVCAAIAYGATAVGLIPPVFVSVPWVMPAGIYAFLATGGNFMAALVSLLNLFLSFVIWTPFVLMANKMKNE
ncbi:PTS sugar transporter subunit IIC [Lacrimispora sp.]|uniref:PTS sugar transporter subunit IIC n=1 Tax=Lacrimispora sp. TaxID=2719234 RepID=UPI003460D8A1